MNGGKLQVTLELCLEFVRKKSFIRQTGKDVPMNEELIKMHKAMGIQGL